MKQVILDLCNERYYYPRTTDDYGMEILAYWLAHDVKNSTDGWIEWLNNDDYEDTDSNATWLEKEITPQGDQEIIFGSLANMINNTKKGKYNVKESDILRISKEKVIEILNTWKQLLKTRPDQIMITEENGIYKMSEVQ